MRDLLRAYGFTGISTAESIAFVQRLDQRAQALGYSAYDNGYREVLLLLTTVLLHFKLGYCTRLALW